MMDTILKVSAAVMVSIILIETQKTEKQLSICLGLLVSIGIISLSVTFFTPVVSFLSNLQEIGVFSEVYLKLVLQITGISLISQFTIQVCDDCGNSSIGKAVLFLSNGIILYMGLPVLNTFLVTVREILRKV